MNNFINDLEWQGNSLAMYKAVLNAVPSFFRGSVNNNIRNWVLKNNIKIVTEETIFKAVDDIAPANIANSRIKPELEKIRRK